MENVVIDQLMRLLQPLSRELKLELITRISESLKLDLQHPSSTSKEQQFTELFGAWKNTAPELTDDILQARSSSDRRIDFD